MKDSSGHEWPLKIVVNCRILYLYLLDPQTGETRLPDENPDENHLDWMDIIYQELL